MEKIDNALVTPTSGKIENIEDRPCFVLSISQ